MKSLQSLPSASIILLLLFSFVRCSKHTSEGISDTGQVLVKNIWTVDYYFHDQDMTEDYTNSRLLFSSTGAVGFQKNGETTAGTWTQNFDTLHNQWISLHFNTNDSHIGELNKSWRLTDQSSSSLQFEETDGATDVLFRLKTQ